MSEASLEIISNGTIEKQTQQEGDETTSVKRNQRSGD